MITVNNAFNRIVLITAFVLSTTLISETLSAKAILAENKIAEKTIKVVAYQTIGEKKKQSKILDSENSSFSNKSEITDNRRSTYRDISDPGQFLNELSNDKIIEATPRKKSVENAIGHKRGKNLATNLKSHEFNIASAFVTMISDLDGDGYYSKFSVTFDADTSYNSASVYALLYLSYQGGPWEHYYSTDYFTINGDSYYDDYTVKTLLTTGYPPGSYDVLIDLHDAYDDSIVATISHYDTAELAEYYLEDISYEGPAIYSDFSIFNASIILLNDDDNDGFYQSFSLQFDADVAIGSALVYAEIWIKDSTGFWQHDFTTEDYIIEGNSTLDTYILETVLESGYPAGYYDYKIEIFDSQSDRLLTTSSNLYDALSDVPLEDAISDLKYNNLGVSNDESIAASSHGSGGAGSIGSLLFLLLVFYRIAIHYRLEKMVIAD